MNRLDSLLDQKKPLEYDPKVRTHDFELEWQQMRFNKHSWQYIAEAKHLDYVITKRSGAHDIEIFYHGTFDKLPMEVSRTELYDAKQWAQAHYIQYLDYLKWNN